MSDMTRAQAIELGELIDVSDCGRMVGFEWPLAITRQAFELCVVWTKADNRRKGRPPQTQDQRLRDVVVMAAMHIRDLKRAEITTRIEYQVAHCPRDSRRGDLITHLVVVVEAGDDGAKALTIKLLHET